MLFDEATIRKLNQLSLVAGKVRAGVIKGERRSSRRGSSVEFADYRNYTPGDDLRRLDWNIYARLERPFIKLLEEEEDLAVYVLVDASRSMDWGEGDLNKHIYAMRLAAALGAVALGAGDHLSVAILRAGQFQAQYGPARGSQHLLRLMAFLEEQKAIGETDLSRSLHAYLLTPRRAGLAFLISDLFSPNGYQPGLWELQGRGFEVNLLHLLAPDELDPPLAGDLRLVDRETGAEQEVSVEGGMREHYRQRLRAWQEENQAECLRRGVRYIPVSTAQAWDELILLGLRRAGVVK
ncbi:MAG: DUF58 domain-containing protein [Anaerolineales bacterium]|nr:DUF58 domain-containing protein [Anaerolineales bacterium]